jgi:starvation-inducible DNA-binding protein
MTQYEASTEMPKRSPMGEVSVTSDGTEMNIGLSKGERKKLADGLSRVLADTYSLYLKTQNFHWNVTGPKFLSLHTIFEQQYRQLAEATDLLAERIRALGFLAPATFSQFLELTSIREDRVVHKADEMIALLVQGHEAVVRGMQSLYPLTEDAHDDATHDVLARRVEEHEKSAWMLRSLLN